MKNRVIILSFSIAAFFSFQACRADLRNAASEINMLKTDHFSYIDYSTQTEGLIIENEDFNTYLLCNNLRDIPVLVLSYSINDCKGCLDNVVKEMSAHIPNIATNQRVLFVVSEARASYEPEYGNTLILERTESLGLPKNITPFLFVYDGCIRHCFFPSGLFNNSFSRYLENIVRRYQLS